VAEAIRGIEGVSCAEIVVEVRARSGSYAHADARFAAIAAFAALIVLLFAPPEFDPIEVAVGVLVAYVVATFIARLSGFIRRSLTTAADRQRRVRMGAAATFVERGVSKTARATGVLVYLSILERRIEVIADRGVLDAVPPLDWNQFLQSTRERQFDVDEIVDVLKNLQPMLAKTLPVIAGDKDELPNELRFTNE
jgi:putative membrane protein